MEKGEGVHADIGAGPATKETSSTAECSSIAVGPVCTSEKKNTQKDSLIKEKTVEKEIVDDLCQQTRMMVLQDEHPLEERRELPLQRPPHLPISDKKWLAHNTRKLIQHMNEYGLCVIDDFFGETIGQCILNEVNDLYNDGVFEDGQVVRSRNNNRGETCGDGTGGLIRSDKVFWANVSDQKCEWLRYLTKRLDLLVMSANKSPDAGAFGNVRITERSEPMVACYPGADAHYVKHVDNPNADGRRITAIYYLNKMWDRTRDGGLLRIFPDDGHDRVADIDPKFDRALFFWSDRRNPHEVQPAKRIRFAVTVWYYDGPEKLAHLQKTTNCK